VRAPAPPVRLLIGARRLGLRQPAGLRALLEKRALRLHLAGGFGIDEHLLRQLVELGLFGLTHLRQRLRHCCRSGTMRAWNSVSLWRPMSACTSRGNVRSRRLYRTNFGVGRPRLSARLVGRDLPHLLPVRDFFELYPRICPAAGERIVLCEQRWRERSDKNDC
jgi:hypothetical protein